MPDNETINVRYMVDDVEASIAFYTEQLGFEVLTSASPAFADVKRGNLRVLLSGPKSSAGRPMTDGVRPGPGGWNRIHFIVADIDAEVARLRRAGATFRNDIVEGPGGKQILLQDPSGNFVELSSRLPADANRLTTVTARRRPDGAPPRPSLVTVATRWGRIGCIGFGGPPAHIALLRELCVEQRRWFTPAEFEDAIAACNLLPGPASTQLAIFSAWSVAGPLGAIVGGIAFIAPGLVLVLGLAALFLAASPPTWILGAAAGTGAAVAAVAVRAGVDLVRPSFARTPARWRWMIYALLGTTAAATLGPWLVLVLLGCGLTEVTAQRAGPPGSFATSPWPLLAVTTPASAGLLALVWMAFKVGALSYGGGFVIIPLMQGDAVNHYHWMTNAQFLNAVALGQVTPGPVVHTVAVVGYAAAGIGGGVLAAFVAFTPSFAFVLLGAPRFDQLRNNTTASALLAGAGPAAIGAILGAAIPLALALGESWQYAVLGAATVSLLVLRRSVVTTLLAAAAVGLIATHLGAPLP